MIRVAFSGKKLMKINFRAIPGMCFCASLYIKQCNAKVDRRIPLSLVEIKKKKWLFRDDKTETEN